jgi:hypothetical protein
MDPWMKTRMNLEGRGRELDETHGGASHHGITLAHKQEVMTKDTSADHDRSITTGGGDSVGPTVAGLGRIE